MHLTLVTYIIIFFFSLIGSVISIPYLIKYLTYSRIVDRPGARRVNKKTIPRMGGIVVYIAILIAVFTFFKDINFARPIILSSIAIVVIGIWDDIKGLKYIYKLVFQFIAALLLLSFFRPMFYRTELFGLVLPFPVNYIIIILFIVGAINSVNLMDGLDGLVAGFSIQVSWMIIILASISDNQFLLIVSLALLGSVMGFLKYNAFPAKIFLGDTGSLSIGFFLVFVALYVSLDFNKGLLDLTFPVILLGVPIVDTLKVILVRLWQKKSPFHPDQNHLHHIIIHGKIRHKTTVGFILLLSTLFAMDALVYLKFYKILGIAIFLFLSLCLLLMQYILPAAANIKSLVKTKNKIVDLTGKNFITFYEFFLPLSLINVIMLILFLFPVSSNISVERLVAVFISVIGMLFVSLFRRQNDQLKDIYVLFNFIIFFIIANFSISFIGKSLYLHSMYKYEIMGSLIFLSFFLVIFLFQREKFNAVGKVFLTGLDMTLIIILISFYAFTVIMPSSRFKFIEINFWETIVLFLWYKMIVYFDNKFSNAVYYFSYALPVLAILSILFFSSH